MVVHHSRYRLGFIAQGQRQDLLLIIPQLQITSTFIPSKQLFQ